MFQIFHHAHQSQQPTAIVDLQTDSSQHTGQNTAHCCTDQMIPQTLFSPLQEPKHREVYTADMELDSFPATKSADVTHKYTTNSRRSVLWCSLNAGSCSLFFFQSPSFNFLYYTKEWKTCTFYTKKKNVAKYNIISICLCCVLYTDMKVFLILSTVTVYVSTSVLSLMNHSSD